MRLPNPQDPASMPYIIYENKNGNVTVCMPTGETSLEYVLENDVPKDVVPHVVHQNTIPREHMDFFEAWKLTVENEKPKISVHHETAKGIAHERINNALRQLHAKHSVNRVIGLPALSDEKILGHAKAARDKVEQATTLDHLRAAISSIPSE